MNSITFFTEPQQGIYKRVFEPLAEGYKTIEESKACYGILPYVKLRTTSENTSEKVELYCNVIHNNSWFTKSFQAFTGIRNAFGNTVNTYLPGTTWNCNRSHTAEALDIAIEVFEEKTREISLELKSINEPATLQALQNEMQQLHSTLTTSLATVFCVYRTYHEIPDTGDEKGELAEHEQKSRNASKPPTLLPQHQRLKNLIESGMQDLLMGIQSKLTPEDSSIEQGEGKDAILEKSEDSNDVVNLVFKSTEAASKWFVKKLAASRASREANGVAVHGDLMKTAKIAKKVPEEFTKLGESLDKTFKDEMARYKSAEEIFAILEAKGLQTTKQPENFQVLLRDLYIQKADQEVYQTLFRALMNEEGTGPRGLQYQPALLNIIINSHYFPMFDPESI